MTESVRTHEAIVYPTTLNAILNMCSGGIAIIQNDRIRYANRAFGEINGLLSHLELGGCLLKDIIPELYNPRLSQVTFTRGGSLITAYTSSFADDRQTLLRLRCTPEVPCGCSQGEIQAARLATETWLRWAHGLNNLLTRIMLANDLVALELESRDGLRRHVETIQNAGMDCAEIIKQMTLPSSNRQLTTLRSWNQVASEMISTLVARLGPSIEIKSELAEPMGLGGISAARASQIILSLVLNAQHTMRRGGTITLSTRNCCIVSECVTNCSQSAPHVEFVITSAKDAAAKRSLTQIFDGPSAHQSSVPPLFGLKMIRKIIKSAGGEFKTEANLGRGTRVTICMPHMNVPTPSTQLARTDGSCTLPGNLEEQKVGRNEEFCRSTVTIKGSENRGTSSLKLVGSRR